jgi:high-affinity nickel permease
MPYPFPIEFTTHDGQHYTFVSAVSHDAVSLNCGHYFTLVRRQEHVFIYDDDRIRGCLHIDDLSNYLKKVIVTVNKEFYIFPIIIFFNLRFTYASPCTLISIHRMHKYGHLKIPYMAYMSISQT